MDEWWVEACARPEMVTFIEIHDVMDIWRIVKYNLSRANRSLLSKSSNTGGNR